MNTIIGESRSTTAPPSWRRPSAGDPDEAQCTRVQKLRPEIINEHEAIIFNGDGYSEAWHQEAAKRGLPNLKTSIDALPELDQRRSRSRCSPSTACFPSASCKAAMDIYLEQYCKTVNVEASAAIEMAKTMIFPAAYPLSERAGHRPAPN